MGSGTAGSLLYVMDQSGLRAFGHCKEGGLYTGKHTAAGPWLDCVQADG